MHRRANVKSSFAVDLGHVPAQVGHDAALGQRVDGSAAGARDAVESQKRAHSSYASEPVTEKPVRELLRNAVLDQQGAAAGCAGQVAQHPERPMP